MKLKPEMLKMLKHHEGVRYKPYLCPAVIWTVGVGRVLYQEQIKLPVARKEGYTGIIRKEFPLRGEDNRVWTQEEVDALLAEDIVRFTRGVARLVNGRASDGQFSAMVSFAFNAGLGALQRSTIRMKHNRGDYEGAAEAFMMWTKGGGRVLPGLVKRRIDEKNLYLS
jgi:GH24 family phage-related lysozyme (muramidase)